MKNKTRFFLHSRMNKDGNRPIYLSFSFDNQRLQCATGQMVEPAKWDAKRYRVKRGALLCGVINAELERIELALATAYTELTKAGTVTPDVLKAKVFPTTEQGEQPRDLLALYTLYKAEVKGTRTEGTMKIHDNVNSHLEKFLKSYNLSSDLNQVTAPFLEKFTHYLLSVAELTNPSAEKVMRTLRAVLQWGNENGIETPSDYKRFTARVFRQGQQSQKVYLHKEDLGKIEALDLNGDERLQRVRDTLLFQVWTGLRYGDLLKLRREHVATNQNGDSVITLVTGKNKRAVEIPLLPTAKRIWQMYEGSLPKITNQRQNKYVKELCCLAKINTPCITVTYRGTQRIEKTLPKYDLIGTHTAKRTFVTLLALGNVSLASIMKITGNSRNTVEAYLVATSQDAVNEVRAKFSE